MNIAMKSSTRAALAMAAVLVLGACTGDAARYETADDLAGALAAADVECAAPEARPPATLVRSHASCGSGASRLELFVFDGTEERDSWLRVGGQLGPVAVGPNWTVSGDTAGQAAAALNARFDVPE